MRLSLTTQPSLRACLAARRHPHLGRSLENARSHARSSASSLDGVGAARRSVERHRPVSRGPPALFSCGRPRRSPSVRQNRVVTTKDHLLTAAIEARVRMVEAQRALLQTQAQFDEAIRELHRAEVLVGEEATGLASIELHAGRLLGGIPSELQMCSFCGASQRDVVSLITGPIFYICDGCVADALQTIEAQRPASRIMLLSTKGTAVCGFCGEGRGETERLFTASGGGRICAECLDVCVDIMAENRV